MRRPTLDNVEIVEPPLEELTKTHSGLKRACAGGCLLLILLVVGLIIAIRIFTGPGPKVIKNVPANFPADIPVYDPDNINKITFISGQYKNRSIEIAAIFPKIILSPIFLALNRDEVPDAPKDKNTSLKNLWKIITTPVGDHRDTAQIEWRGIDTTPKFIYSYYKNELSKKNFVISEEIAVPGSQQFSFSRSDGISGVFFVEDNDENQPRTDYLLLTVNINSD